MKNEELEYKFPAPYFRDWDSVDERYQWRAFDADGQLFYYINTPVLDEELNIWRAGIGTFSCNGKATGRWASKIWRNSLERRPQSQTTNQQP